VLDSNVCDVWRRVDRRSAQALLELHLVHQLDAEESKLIARRRAEEGVLDATFATPGGA